MAAFKASGASTFASTGCKSVQVVRDETRGLLGEGASSPGHVLCNRCGSAMGARLPKN